MLVDQDKNHGIVACENEYGGETNMYKLNTIPLISSSV